MTQKTTKKPVTAGKPKFKPIRRRSSRTAIVFWICLVLVLAPFVYLGWTLYSSSLNTHKPVIGNRYKNDLNPAIKKSEMDQVKSKASAVEGVENVDVELATGTLRVYADIKDDATADTAKAAADAIYKGVSEVLDPSVYFTKTDSEKMYDLEIHVYTTAERSAADDNNFVYVVETKTSSMDAPETDVVSTAKDAELAQKLRDDVTARASASAAAEAAASAGGTITGQDEQATAAPEQ